MSYPVLNFKTTDENGHKIDLKWYPSEYLFREKENKYCMAIEKYSRPGELLLGGSFMRQTNYIFDVDQTRIGFSRARCNNDPNFIESEQEMITAGHQRYGLDPTHTESLVQNCQHGRSVVNNGGTTAVTPIATQPEVESETSVSTKVLIFVAVACLVAFVLICVCCRRKKRQSDIIDENSPQT